MAAFVYKVPGLNKAPADVAGRVCQELEGSAEGLTPKTLLDASRDESAPLHGEFEWDDGVAAEKYRLDQARSLIRNICIITEKSDGTKVTDRQFVITPGGRSQYVALGAALSNEKWHDNLLEQARRECQNFIGKYRRLKELTGVTGAMESFLKEGFE